MEAPSPSFSGRRPSATDLPNFRLPPPDHIPVALNRSSPAYSGSSSATHGTFGPWSTPGSSGSSYSYGSASAASRGLTATSLRAYSQEPLPGEARFSLPPAPSSSKTLKPTDSSSYLPPSPKWPSFPPTPPSGPASSSSSSQDPGPGPSYRPGITMIPTGFPSPQPVTSPSVNGPPSAASSLRSMVPPPNMYNPYGQTSRPVLTNVHQPGTPLNMMSGGGMMVANFSPYGFVPQERPFKCDGCPQSFNRNHDLKRHKRIHLTVKPFPCLHCEKSFSRRDALKRHRLVKGCGEKPRAPSPGASDDGGSKMKSSDVTGSSDAEVSRIAAPALPLSAERAAVRPETNIGSRPHIKEETPESRSGHDTSPSSDPLNMSLSPRPSALPMTPKFQTRSSKDEAMGSLSSQTPRSDLDSIATETFLDERKSRMIECVVRDVTSRIKAMFLQTRGSSSATSNPSGPNMASKPSENTPNTTCSATGKERTLKRKMDDRGSGNTDEEDEGTDNHTQKDADGPKEENPGYACPYFKYNPSLYKSARGCPGPGWPNVHRVKEHLYRRHQQPKHRCRRCWQPFKNEASYLDHQRMPEPCSLREMEHVEGFDADQKERLQSRKRVKGSAEAASETDKWRDVYRILFPHVESDDIPSPFYEYGELLAANTRGHHTSHDDRLTECEAYLLREVPLRLRQSLCREVERNFSIVEETIRREASARVKDLIAQVFEEFRSQSALAVQTGEGAAATAEKLPEPQQAQAAITDEEDPFAQWDFSQFSSDPFVMMGDEELRYDGDGLLENLLRPTGDAESAGRLSDSGYGSGSPEAQRYKEGV